MKITKVKATILIVLISIGIVFIAKVFLKSSHGILLGKSINHRAKGDPKAPFQIIEYLDFQCAACAKGTSILKEYFQKYPSKIYLEIRYYPISRIHQHALRSAVYAECMARQNKFWPFEELLIEKQLLWSRLLDVDRMFRELAEGIGGDLTGLDRCIEDENVKAVVLTEKEKGKKLGVDSTPTYFINGKMVVGSNNLSQELASLLGEKSH